jgi:hypothetical protein
MPPTGTGHMETSQTEPIAFSVSGQIKINNYQETASSFSEYTKYVMIPPQKHS